MMAQIYRPNVKIGDCTTLSEAGLALGGSKNMLDNHKRYGTEGFPKPVAKFGPAELYVMSEMEAFYNSVLWRQADRSIKELREGA